MKRYIVIGALLLSGALFVGCGNSSKSKKTDYSSVETYMDTFISTQMEQHDIVGLSVALIDDQKIVWQKGFGYADKANAIKATPKTRYRAGSITKLFTAMAAMKLVEEGSMDIDQPFVNYLPEFSIKSRFGSTDEITPRNIMTHHSGLPGDWGDRMFSDNPLPYNQYVDEIKESYVAYAPNTIYSYSNLAVTLLGDAIEKTSGELYSDYVSKTLLKPLGMKDSDLKMALEGTLASKAYMEKEEIQTYSMGAIPAGALNTTVIDLSRLAMMVNNHGSIDGTEVLKQETLKKMLTVQNSDVKLDLGMKIGLAWFIDTDILSDNESVYQHGGDTIAYHASFMVASDSKLGVVVLTNSVGANADEIATTLLQKAWEKKTGKKLTQKTVQESVTNDFELEGVYSSSMFGGIFEIIKKDSDTYAVTTLDGSEIPLQHKENGTYSVEDFEFYTQHIENEDIIIGRKDHKKFIAAVKVTPEFISDIWQNRLGRYSIVDSQAPENLRPSDVLLSIHNGFLLISYLSQEEPEMHVLKIINDNEAITAELGRSQRETLSFKDDMVYYQGLQYQKIDELFLKHHIAGISATIIVPKKGHWETHRGYVSKPDNIPVDNEPNLALAHDKEKVMHEDYAAIAGAGGFVSNSKDMSLFLSALLTGKVLPTKNVHAMMKDLYPMFDKGLYYGRGIMLYGFNKINNTNNIWLGHAGGTEHYRAILIYDVNTKTIVAISINEKIPVEAVAMRLLEVMN